MLSVNFNAIQRWSEVSARYIKTTMSKEGLHLKIGTLHYPPFIFQDQEKGSVYGIEPSLLRILAEQLNFTFEYAFASPNEMWGEIFDFGGSNLTIIGLIGMLHRGEVDVALGDLYVDYNRKKYIDYTQPYGMGYECFMVPVPRPYPKWTALYGPFQWPVWIATFLSFTFAALTMRLTAQRYKAASTFKDFYLCILYVLGNILGVHQNQHGIRLTTSRLLFIIWLFCSFIIATMYRSVLISFMTSPNTPPPVDTIQQLIDSPIGKITFGTFIQESLLSSNIPLLRVLGEQLIVNYNLTYMYSLMDSETWAVQSSKEGLEFEVSKRFLEANIATHQMHLMLECVLPALNAFGLQKNSPLQTYFDREIQELLEYGFIEFHRSEFGKRPNDNGVRTTENKDAVVEPLSLNDLQGAFYLLLFGYFLSLTCYVLERFTHRLIKLWYNSKKDIGPSI